MTQPPAPNYPRPHLTSPQGPQCPSCGSNDAAKVTLTWWGGVVGPRIMNLHKCRDCNCRFNSVTGKPADRAILAYALVGLAVALLVVAVAGFRRY